MDTKAVTGPQQKPNATTPAQQPSQTSNMLLQANPLLQPGQQFGPLQPTSNLGSQQQTSYPAGTYQQPNPQANYGYGAVQQPNPQTNYGSLQQQNPQSNYGAVQQPNPQTKQVSFQPSNQQTSLVPYQQPNPQTNLGAWQQPNPQTNLGAWQQPTPQTNLGATWHQPNPLGSSQPSSLLSKLAPSAMNQLIRGDRSMLTLSDDNVLVSHILGSHSPDGRDVDVKPLLRLVEDILRRATLTPDALLTTGSQTYLDPGFDDKTHHTSFLAMLEALSYTIDRIACELQYKALGSTDAHQTTVAIFNMVSHYGWDAKLVLALAAFGLNYGEFWLLAQIYSTNQLAKAMAILKQVPGIIEHAVPLKPRFDALNELIRTILEVTWCVIEFRDLPSIYITTDVPALASALTHIPTAVYWTIRSIVACASQISSFTTIGYEFALSTSEAWELSTLTHKLKTILEHLKKKMDECIRYIEERRDVESYKMLVELFKMIHIDNMRVLKALICPRDDVLALVDGNTKKRVNLDVLRRKNVLLLISSLDITQDELSVLEQSYNESRVHEMRLQSPYEVVWIPIVDQLTDAKQRHFEELQNPMTWYSVYHPSIISKASVKFIREEWNFRNKPILVVLDPQGRVVSPNAIHMMWIWGSHAFPFTTLKEETLWREEAWRLELLVDGIDATILNWIKEGKYIFVYGGDDMEWIRKFTKEAKAIAAAARIPLEMVYVGKAAKKEQVKRVIANIVQEKLSTCWQDPATIWFFWTRLESMLFSKIQLGKDEEHDLVMQQIKRVLSFDREGTWAVLSRGSSVLVNEHGNLLWSALFEYDQWKENVPLQGFDVAFQNYVATLRGNSHPCCRFEFSHYAGKIPESMKCPECHHYMEKYTTFLCCHDEGIVPSLLALTTNT
ncbi:protein SIEVE ELEMENT OCCLUSION B-like [Quercus robur]|uniref:protein SIEVE ELEMENT OCCLUSION B-like n=1 Tax=Quercus robur TaxID=38942 RepID=UPI0021629B05|nr:protein SIEVE ELEMENT OCCLUSION B-like [Quercus robur]